MTNREQLNDLLARMLTCAHYVTQLADASPAVRDAASLLIEAAAALEATSLPLPENLGLPWKMIEAPPTPPAGSFTDPGVGGAPAARNPRACPKCDSRTAKKVTRSATGLTLHCPVCDASWKFTPQAVWQ